MYVYNSFALSNELETSAGTEIFAKEPELAKL